jgi:formate-dependent nitrite reductase membrane component NrfD
MAWAAVAREGELVSARSHWDGSLERGDEPPRPAPEEEPPATSMGRETDWIADHDERTRDMRPALGEPGGPAEWREASPGAGVALAGKGFADARWSFLFKAPDTSYAAVEPEPGQVAEANRRMRGAPVPELRGPFVKPPVWTWEVLAYFWAGGVAAGSAFVALACDVAGDARSAAIARKVALAAVGPAPMLLIGDLGRPERFLNMLRVFKPRSPMNVGAWCLAGFSASAATAVAADLARRPRAARGAGALTALLGGYLGSYTGVLLACTAVPLWSRSRLLLGPIFVSTATATGAAATRLSLTARGLPDEHPTNRTLSALETGAIVTELALSAINERAIGKAAGALHRGTPGRLYRGAQAAVLLGLSAQVMAARRRQPGLQNLASVAYLAGGLAFRFAWVEGGKASAADDEAAAELGRREPPTARLPSELRAPVPLPGVRRAWGEAIRRTSLALERVARR